MIHSESTRMASVRPLSSPFANLVNRVRVTKFVKREVMAWRFRRFFAWEDWAEPHNRHESKAVARMVTKV
jgi:hypothetical protein